MNKNKSSSAMQSHAPNVFRPLPAAVLCALAFLLATSDLAYASGMQALEKFLQNTHSAQADFTQTVTAPAQADAPARTKTSRGTFAFVRPKLFRFTYTHPFEQIIVADGQNIWVFDADLNQVTQRNQAQALANTPAALLTSAGSLADLQKNFILKEAPDKDGVQWVSATPRQADSQLRQVRMGFANGEDSPQLAALEIEDNFGQHSAIRFANMQSNPALPTALFTFTPPAGADVLRP